MKSSRAAYVGRRFDESEFLAGNQRGAIQTAYSAGLEQLESRAPLRPFKFPRPFPDSFLGKKTAGLPDSKLNDKIVIFHRL